jgi:hypothetical protein
MMKKQLFLTSVMTFTLFFTVNLIAQEEENEKSSPFSAGADFYSSYIWRGTKYGTGPAFQPSVTLSAGGFTAGAWGSFDAAGYMESDLYVTYDFDFGLSLGAYDYYQPDVDTVTNDYFDVSDTTGNHAFELMAGYSIKGLSLSANCILNEAGGAGSVGGDLYFQAGYDFKYFGMFLGAGNGWYTSDGKFMVCNVGITTSKTIQVTEKFSFTISGQVILNPEKEKLYAVVGISL